MFKREKTTKTLDRRERRLKQLEADAVVSATYEYVEDRLALSRVRIGVVRWDEVRFSCISECKQGSVFPHKI